MDNSEALKKIDEIHSVIAGSNKAILSGERMMVTGAMVAMIPLIEWLTHSLTFGYAYLTKFHIENLSVFFGVYNGLSLIAMGLFLRKARAVA
jgi:hypothetical protein